MIKSKPIVKFDFLLGDWDLAYKIPRSTFSEEGSDSGTGSFKKILNDQYITFEYATESGGAAQGIFAPRPEDRHVQILVV
jgi:hypothetical protein